MIFNFESGLGIPIPHPEMTSVVLFLLLTFEENLWSQFQFLF
jgi:hypothetical protein